MDLSHIFVEQYGGSLLASSPARFLGLVTLEIALKSRILHYNHEGHMILETTVNESLSSSIESEKSQDLLRNAYIPFNKNMMTFKPPNSPRASKRTIML